MDTQRRFFHGILVLSAVAFVFFTLEFLWEWDRLGRPGVEQLSYAGDSKNVKMVDVLSPMLLPLPYARWAQRVTRRTCM